MASLRERILERIVERLKDCTAIERVFRHYEEHSAADMPFAILGPAVEDLADETIGLTRCSLNVEVLFLVDGPNQDAVLIAAQKALMLQDDRKLGLTFVNDARVTSRGHRAMREEQSAIVPFLQIEIDYHHKAYDPSAVMS